MTETDLAALAESLRSKYDAISRAHGVPPFDYGKFRFLKSLPGTGRILDVGCGNNSPAFTKSILPQWYYAGIDISDYNQPNPEAADEYVLVSPPEFSGAIARYKGSMDATISSHNLEHCNDRAGTLRAMGSSLKSGGRIYLSFPTQTSVTFRGGRNGCLNYFDDATHKEQPPAFGEVISVLVASDFEINYAATNYQPPIDWIRGLLNEEESAAQKQTKAGTWALWGFETIIWATKK